MNKKKSYSSPQLFHVKLNHEQAILSACSITTTNASNGGGAFCNVSWAFGAGCKSNNMNVLADNAARPS